MISLQQDPPKPILLPLAAQKTATLTNSLSAPWHSLASAPPAPHATPLHTVPPLLPHCLDPHLMGCALMPHDPAFHPAHVHARQRSMRHMQLPLGLKPVPAAAQAAAQKVLTELPAGPAEHGQ